MRSGIFTLRLCLFLFWFLSAADLWARPAGPQALGTDQCQGQFRRYVGIRFAEATRVIAAGTDEGWVFDHRASPSYDATFGVFLGESGFRGLFARRRAAGLSNHVLDLMGSAVFTRPDNADLDSLTGARLTHLSRAELPAAFPHPLWRELAGNLYSRRLWHQISARLSELQVGSYDVIIARPAGGLLSQKASLAGIPMNIKAAADLRLIHRAYALLSPNGGQLFFEYDRLPGDEMTAWLQQLKDAGIAYDTADRRGAMFPVMTITKGDSHFLSSSHNRHGL